MKRILSIVVLVFMFSILFTLLCSFAEERITLTTYYPAPYGVYRELRTNGIAVGSNYRYDPEELADGVIIVEVSAGIGTVDPLSMLSVAGGATIGSNYTAIVAPADGLLVEGSTGIGTDAPASMLSVAGGATVGENYTSTAAPAEGLLVAGDVGIGTDTPASKLSVAGGATVGGGYAATAAPGSNSLLVEGRVGIGTDAPGVYDGRQTRLDVDGYQATRDVWLKDQDRWASEVSITCTWTGWRVIDVGTICGFGFWCDQYQNGIRMYCDDGSVTAVDNFGQTCVRCESR